MSSLPSLNSFKSKFFGGTRANRFVITGTIGGQTTSFGQFNGYHVRSTQIPQVSSKVISYDHLGRKYYYPGEKEYGTWSFQVLDDHNGSLDTSVNLWAAFQNWQNYINSHVGNVSSDYRGGYKNEAGWKIQQLDINGNTVVKEFQLIGCWPTAIQPINFNMQNPNLFNTFNVVIVYDQIQLTGYDGEVITPVIATTPTTPPGTS